MESKRFFFVAQLKRHIFAHSLLVLTNESSSWETMIGIHFFPFHPKDRLKFEIELLKNKSQDFTDFS